MKIKKGIFSMVFLLSLKVVLAQEGRGPFSFLTGREGLIGIILDGVALIFTRVLTAPFMPFVAVFFLVFSVIYYLARKMFFKEDKYKNAAIGFSLAIAGISMAPQFGIVDFVASGSAALVGLLFLFIFIFWVWIVWNNLRAQRLESSAEAERAGTAREEAFGQRMGAQGRAWGAKGERREAEEGYEGRGREIREERGREFAQRRARGGLRQSATEVNNNIFNLDNIILRRTGGGSGGFQSLINDPTTNRLYNALIASLQRFRNELMDYDPAEVRNLDNKISGLFRLAQIVPGNPADLTTNNNNIRISIRQIQTIILNVIRGIRP